MIKNTKKGFTIIELIVVMAIIGILVLLAIPKFMGHTQQAKFTKLVSNTKQLEKASERYYMDKQYWPRLTDVPYTSVQVTAFAQKIHDSTGAIVTLDTNGEYYDVDYSKLSQYISIPDDKTSYIIQNPVGNIYSMEGLTPQAETRIEDVQKPKAIMTMTPSINIKDDTAITFSYGDSTVFKDRTISNVEWSNQLPKYTVGEQTVKLRVKDSTGTWSDWTSVTFNVVSSGPQPIQATVPVGYIGIYTAADLNTITSNKSYILMKNIDLNISPYNAGLGWAPKYYANGTFDGNGLTIKNLYINNTTTNNLFYQGLFSQVSTVTIKNLRLENPRIICNTGIGMGSYVGALVGQVGRYSTIEKIGVDNPTIVGNSHVGGLIGAAEWSATSDYINIRQNYVKNANITGADNVGGLVGLSWGLGNTNIKIENNYVSGNVKWTPQSMYQTNEHIGGLVGDNNCSYVGKYNYTVVTVPAVPADSSGHMYRGTIYGWNAIYDSYYNKDVSNVGYYSNNSSWGRTTVQMKQKATYTGWDFTNIWAISEGTDYPHLIWESR